MKREEIKYCIGLDIGTNSVGWAVTDMNSQLLKKGNKNLWGANLFDTADTAAARRMNRSQRRRYNKRRERIQLLRRLLEKMVLKADPVFFLKLNSSFLDEEDKMDNLQEMSIGKYNIFGDDVFTDKDYYKQFPTIYHLRHYLCHTDEKADPRLIYLALHHIVKYRGNFLYEGQSFNLSAGDKSKELLQLITTLNEANGINDHTYDECIDDIVEELISHKVRKQKVDNIINICKAPKDVKEMYKHFFTGLLGNAFTVSKMLVGTSTDWKPKFSDAKYDEEVSEKEAELGENIEVIYQMHDFYSWIVLNEIIDATQEEVSISNSMIKRYNDHHDDLVKLKECLTKHYEVYCNVFKNNGKQNYYHYIHGLNHKPVSRDDFYKFLQKELKSINDPVVKEALEKIELEEYLLKQNDRNNGAIPYQLNEMEMAQIIDNQSRFYPELKENRDKLLSILTFRIPYYFGPLNSESTWGWIVKNEGMEKERILPWNYQDVVNVDATAEAFINNLTNYCTYLPSEKVMPKNSLTCTMYEVLAEVNKMKSDGHFLLKGDTKLKFINEVFKSKNKVTEKDLKRWLENNNMPVKGDVTGFQKENEFSTTLKPWRDFTRVLGHIDDSNYDMIENIIHDITVFEDKKILARRLKIEYPSLTEVQRKEILKLKYTGWSRLSHKLIDGIKTRNKFSKVYPISVLEVMKTSNMALMEIVSDKDLGYKKIIEDAIIIKKDKITYEDIKELACSPSVKKGIWQAICVVDEIVHYMKHEPERIFVEFAREEAEKKRTQSQVKKIKEGYKELSLSKNEKTMQEISEYSDNTSLNNEALYLYFTQNGKCMYSGKKLDIENLHLYQIDHILPQSLIKDDSLDNKVLVIAGENQRKLDDLTVPFEVRQRQEEFWKKLLDAKLISQTKYFRLMRNEYSENEKAGFINRQLVETRQIIKHVANILNKQYEQSSIIAIRANLSHDFRIKYGIPKNRDVNDYHHAHDAYISCILGNFVQIRYPKMDAKYIYGEYLKYKKEKVQHNDKSGYILNAMNYDHIDQNTGEVLWKSDFITSIKKCFYYKDCFITRKLEESDGSLFNLTVLPGDKNSGKNKTEAKVPVNKQRADVNKYGGFSGLTYTAYAIEGMKKKKEVRLIVGVPIVYKGLSQEALVTRIEEDNGLTNVRVLSEIKKNQLIKTTEGVFYITSHQEIINARQLVLNEKEMEIVSRIYIADAKKEYDKVSNEEFEIIYESLLSKMKSYYLKYASECKKFEDNKKNFVKLTQEDKCTVIKQWLIVLHANASNGNIKLKTMNIGDRIGRRQVTINLTGTIFIKTSITGIYSKEYTL